MYIYIYTYEPRAVHTASVPRVTYYIVASPIFLIFFFFFIFCSRVRVRVVYTKLIQISWPQFRGRFHPITIVDHPFSAVAVCVCVGLGIDFRKRRTNLFLRRSHDSTARNACTCVRYSRPISRECLRPSVFRDKRRSNRQKLLLGVV